MLNSLTQIITICQQVTSFVTSATSFVTIIQIFKCRLIPSVYDLCNVLFRKWAYFSGVQETGASELSHIIFFSALRAYAPFTDESE